VPAKAIQFHPQPGLPIQWNYLVDKELFHFYRPFFQNIRLQNYDFFGNCKN
jgi:hypothetical protein